MTFLTKEPSGSFFMPIYQLKLGHRYKDTYKYIYAPNFFNFSLLHFYLYNVFK